MTVMYRQFFEFPELRSGFYWYTHMVGMAVSLLCAVLGSLHGARAMLRLQPAAAMRPEPPRAGRRIWLERLGSWLDAAQSPWQHDVAWDLSAPTSHAGRRVCRGHGSRAAGRPAS